MALSFKIFSGLNLNACMMHVSALWLTFRFSTTKVPYLPQDGWYVLEDGVLEWNALVFAREKRGQPRRRHDAYDHVAG